MCCTQLAWNAGPKKSPKVCHLGTIAQLCQAISSQLRHVLTIWKKTVKQQCLPHMCSQYGELRPTSHWGLLVSLGTSANFNRFRALASLLYGTRVVGVSQSLRHWSTFGRAAIKLGIGPHSSLVILCRYIYCAVTEVIVFHVLQANVICVVYSVEDFTSVEKVLFVLL